MSEQRFVARERELDQLQGFLARAVSGQGQTAFVVGEAGSGKSALLAEFSRRAETANGDLVIATGTCNAQTGIGDPYLPFREILAQLTGDVEAGRAKAGMSLENARRLEGVVRWTIEALVDLGPDLINVLVPGSKLIGKAGAFVLDQFGWPDKLKQLVDSKAAGAVAPTLEQSRIFEQMTDVLKSLAARQPLVLALDDLHWADNASISLLFHLGRRIGTSRILVLGAYRPEEVQVGRGHGRHPLEKVLAECKRYFGDICVDLDRAERQEARQFVEALLDLEPNRLGPSFRRVLEMHTGGHPLFAVELLRHMQEQGDLVRDAGGYWVESAGLDWDTLPPRVEGVIEERIGRLQGELKETLRIGSVEGEQFTAEVIARVRKVEERELVGRLSNELDRQHHLVTSQGTRRLGEQPLSAYSFRHNLFQKYLYDSLDGTQRAYLHEDVGRVLETLYGDQKAEIAVQLARHFEEAGLVEQTIRYLHLAAERAMFMSANAEAMGHLNRALALLQKLPATPERDRLELPLQMDLGTAILISQGWAAPGVGTALERARDLCHATEDTARLISVLRSLYTHLHALARHRAVYELAQQLLALAQEAKDPAFIVMAHHALGQTEVELGELVKARETLERGLAYHRPEQYRKLAYLYGEEHGVSSRIHLAFSLLGLGYAEQADVRVREALILAEALGHPHVLAYTLCAASSVYLFHRENGVGLAHAERAMALCKEKGIPFWQSVASLNRGYALARQGRVSEGIAEMTQGLVAYRAIGARVLQTAYLVQLAEMHLLGNQVNEGLAAADEGLAAVNETDERLMEAELHRLRAELLRKQGREAEAEAELLRSLEVARAQQARWWELRAAMSLCRLWRDRGEHADARRMLAQVYGWFTEGFDTADLQEANRLLEELAQ